MFRLHRPAGTKCQAGARCAGTEGLIHGTRTTMFRTARTHQDREKATGVCIVYLYILLYNYVYLYMRVLHIWRDLLSSEEEPSNRVCTDTGNPGKPGIKFLKLQSWKTHGILKCYGKLMEF